MNSERMKECTQLSSEILKNFELSELPISNIIFKCLRLCRLLGDEDGCLLFSYESAGYPNVDMENQDFLRICRIAGRVYYKNKNSSFSDPKSKKRYVNVELIGEIETSMAAQKIQLSSAKNSVEADDIVQSISESQKWLEKIRGNLYNYILGIYNKLVYGNIIEDVFTRSRLQTNEKLSKLCPESIKKFVSVYENMDSNNPEDWANAVHSCRRILVDLADVLYPPKNEPIEIGGRQINVGPNQYINRLIQFIDSKKTSDTFNAVVGSNLKSIGDRLDSINDAVCKGTHADISKDEAARYIIHTYLLISDIIALMN